VIIALIFFALADRFQATFNPTVFVSEDLLTFMVLLFEDFMPLLYSQLSASIQNKAMPAYFFSPRELK
jgi:hypothetical protein